MNAATLLSIPTKKRGPKIKKRAHYECAILRLEVLTELRNWLQYAVSEGLRTKIINAAIWCIDNDDSWWNERRTKLSKDCKGSERSGLTLREWAMECLTCYENREASKTTWPKVLDAIKSELDEELAARRKNNGVSFPVRAA